MTSWYIKPYNTLMIKVLSLMFNLWESHGPKIYKINLIKKNDK